MSDTKFLGICILIAATVMSGAILWHGNASAGRYQAFPKVGGIPTRIIDTRTGIIADEHLAGFHP